MKQYLSCAGWALGMLVLILDGKTAMDGAAKGVQLCIQTLIPSLFPFFLLSGMLTSSLSGGGLLLTGILGGYPVGAGNAASAYRAGQLCRADARRMVVLCNCPGPSFLFGVIAPALGSSARGMIVWLCCLVSVFALRLVFPKAQPASSCAPPVKLQQALFDAIRAMAGVCGWVILFRVILSILDRWVLWLLPDWGRIAVYGILELSNGCLALKSVNPELGTVLAAGFAAFGGLCVMLQTASVAEGIFTHLYFPGKIFQCAVSMLAASFFCPGAVSPVFQVSAAVFAVVLGFGLRKNEKRCGNRSPVIV